MLISNLIGGVLCLLEGRLPLLGGENLAVEEWEFRLGSLEKGRIFSTMTQKMKEKY